ncbi:MAG: family 10 glycosylhydrolase [Prevotella sp.]|nr:family 10 glycosylhydrolase [Prevotella sp.]
MKRFLAIIFFFNLYAAAARAQTLPAMSFDNIAMPFADNIPPKREARAVWLTTIGGLDWPHTYSRGNSSEIALQKRELTDILDRLQRAGTNIVLFQTRIRATVVYPSAIEPWDGCLSGVPGLSPGYDALAFAIDECHRRGMELHAWVVVMPVGKWKGKGCSELRKKRPAMVKRIGDEAFMDPENAATAGYIAGICEEITRGYDIDGIHLDYIRYPEAWTLKVAREQGRKNITAIVREVHSRVKSLKPWVKISCSPVGKFSDLPRQSSHGWNAYSRVCQDAQGWLREGLMDALFPMMYFRANDFYPFLFDWQEASAGRIIAPGLAVYSLAPSEHNWPLKDITQQLAAARSLGLGHAFFRSRFFTTNTKGIYSFTANDFDANYALVPAMTWEKSTPPTPPQTLIVDSLASTISWSGAKDNSGGPNLLYNVYSSAEWPVNTSDPRNLILPRTARTSTVAPLTGRYFAITALDRFGNESEAIQQAVKRTEIKLETTMLPCDGETLTIGRLPLNSSDILQIETLQGKAVATFFQSENIDVSHLPHGIYILRAIGKKGVTHRIGFFKIDRIERIERIETKATI